MSYMIPLIHHQPLRTPVTPRRKMNIVRHLCTTYPRTNFALSNLPNLNFASIAIVKLHSSKYFDAHKGFKQVLLNYTDTMMPKSVDCKKVK